MKLEYMKHKPKQTNKFRVPVNIPELWKVKSIAVFLKEKRIKKKAHTENFSKNNPFDNNNSNANERATVDEELKKQEIRQELDMLQKEGNTIRQKIQTFNNVRNSLVWLLNKSKACEKACTSVI
jgi:hypothetical protein